MEQLFGSKTRTKLLRMFMSNPNRSFYVREITRKIEEQINSVRRELANLLSLGVITSDSTNNKLYYEVRQDYEHYDALRMLFTGKKPVAQKEKQQTEKGKKAQTSAVAVDVDTDVWNKAGKVYGLLYAGSFTRDKLSPVDIMIIGDVPVSRAEAAVAELEVQEGKTLRYAIMDIDEWTYRRQVNDKFYAEVMSAKKQIIKDEQALFEQK